MIYKFSETDEELKQILQLQAQNHKDSVDEDTKAKQGFVTVKHSFSEIKALNNIEKHTILKVDNQVEAYVLAMTKKSKNLIPILEPMFKIFDEIFYKNKKISEYKYMVCGQVCVGEKVRGKGVFDEIYQFYRENLEKDYDFCITEIAVNNTRSIRAHERIGFKTIHRYTDVFGIDWLVVLWDWR